MSAATSGNCHVPGPFPAAGAGNAAWKLKSGFHFAKLPYTTLKQNKFYFPRTSGEFLHVGMQCKENNSLLSGLMVKAEADSQKLHEEKKRRTAPCKNSQLLLELVHQATSFILSPPI